MKNFYRGIAVFLGIIHVPIVLIIFFGWLLNGFWSYFYLVVLILTLLSWLLLGYCPITKWEFDIRKKYMKLPDYNYGYLHYWGYKLFRINIDPRKVKIYGSLFIIASIVLWFFK